MKRLLSFAAAVLLLLTLLPVAVSAQTTVTAAYADGKLSLSWSDPAEVLKEISDSSGRRHTPHSSAPGSADFLLPLTVGTHHFTAFFESSTYANFSVTVEAVEPGFRVDSLSWDNAAKELTVHWQADVEVTLHAITVGGTEYPVYNSENPLTVTLGTLSPGEHTVQYTFEALGETHTFSDSAHSFFCTGGTVSTSLAVSAENGEVVITVHDAFGRPVSGVTVRVTLGSTDWLPQTTDENGQVHLAASLAEVTRVRTDDFETDDTVYTGAVYEPAAQSTTSSRTTSPNQEVIATTASTRRSTTKPRTSETTEATTAVSGLSTHVGPMTTGAEQDLIALNLLTDENMLKALSLTGEKLDTDTRLLVSPSLYKALAAKGKTVPMLSLLSGSRTFSAAQAKTLISQELSDYNAQSVRVLTMDLGIQFWDQKAGKGTPLTDLPEGDYIIRLPRPADMADCNRFYVVSLAGETVGEPIEAVVEPEYIQFTLSDLGPVALFACESDMSSAGLYIHPIAFVFLTIGIVLLLLAAVMIYFFFIRRDPAAAAAGDIDVSADENTDIPAEDSGADDEYDQADTDDDRVSLDIFLRDPSDKDGQ